MSACVWVYECACVGHLPQVIILILSFLKLLLPQCSEGLGRGQGLSPVLLCPVQLLLVLLSSLERLKGRDRGSKQHLWPPGRVGGTTCGPPGHEEQETQEEVRFFVNQHHKPHPLTTPTCSYFELALSLSCFISLTCCKSRVGSERRPPPPSSSTLPPAHTHTHRGGILSQTDGRTLSTSTILTRLTNSHTSQ